MPDSEKEKRDDKTLAESREMDQFYRSLAVTHSNAVTRVMIDRDPAAIIERATIEIDRMRVEENDLEHKAHKCGKNEIWDETLRRCIAI